MVKYTKTIRRLLLTNCLSIFDHFVRFAFKELKIDLSYSQEFFWNRQGRKGYYVKLVLFQFLKMTDCCIKNSTISSK